jgi:hypothetical protein
MMSSTDSCCCSAVLKKEGRGGRGAFCVLATLETSSASAPTCSWPTAWWAEEEREEAGEEGSELEATEEEDWEAVAIDMLSWGRGRGHGSDVKGGRRGERGGERRGGERQKRLGPAVNSRFSS